MNCLKHARCVWFTAGDKRNIMASTIAGIFFFTGWWFLIDACVMYPGALHPWAHACGILSTISLLIVNSISNAQVRGEMYTGGCVGPRGARLWLFIGLVIGFASLIAACWLFLSRAYPIFAAGLALLVQNFFILIASFVYKYGRREDYWAM